LKPIPIFSKKNFTYIWPAVDIRLATDTDIPSGMVQVVAREVATFIHKICYLHSEKETVKAS